MIWIKTASKHPDLMRDVLMYFEGRDVFCLGWLDDDGDWFIWKGMDDSTRIDGPPAGSMTLRTIFRSLLARLAMT